MSVLVNITSKIRKQKIEFDGLINGIAKTAIVLSLSLIAYFTYQISTIDLSGLKLPIF